VATFTDGNPNATAADFQAIITWGDGQTSPGTIVYNPAQGSFAVLGSHTYTQAGTYGTSVSISGGAGRVTLTSGVAEVAIGSLLAEGLTVTASRAGLYRGAVATFTDPDRMAAPRDFVATIRWGDGHTSRGRVVQRGGPGARFLVKGRHLYSKKTRFIVEVSIVSRNRVQSASVHSTLHFGRSNYSGKTPAIEPGFSLSSAVTPTPDLSAHMRKWRPG
jgi:hypothetical protein